MKGELLQHAVRLLHQTPERRCTPCDAWRGRRVPLEHHVTSFVDDGPAQEHVSDDVALAIVKRGQLTTGLSLFVLSACSKASAPTPVA